MGSVFVWVFCCMVLVCTPAQGQFFEFDNVLFGCYNKTLTVPPDADYQDNSLTLQKCRDRCADHQSTFFGVSDGTQCVCFKEQVFPSASFAPQPQRSCFSKTATRCSGDPGQYCGTTDAYLIYTVCPHGKGGSDCTSHCSCSNEHICLLDNTCSGLCSSGTTLFTCNPCQDNKYGYGCAGTCSIGCTGCNKATGQCSFCQGGIGPYCEGCPAGRHGAGCGETCSDRCKDSNCDDTGECYSCLDSEAWGLQCQKKCSRNCLGETCDIKTGECENGCKHGYYGAKCDITCPECAETCDIDTGVCSQAGCVSGYYGAYCNQSCSDRCFRECDRDNGSCIACAAGFYGDECNRECKGHCSGKLCERLADSPVCSDGCDNGYYGNTCEETCPEHCLDNKCERDGGNCLRCVPGKQGGVCDVEVTQNPVVTEIHPRQGPVAGGTRVTVYGRQFIPGVLVRFGHLLLGYNSSNDTVAVVTTLPVNGSFIDKDLRVSVQFPGFDQVQLDATFTYKDNPQLQSIHPLEANIIGGTTLTVSGIGLDIIGYPNLLVTMVHTYIEAGSRQQDSTVYTSPCTVRSTTTMHCPTPSIDNDLPDSFRNDDKGGKVFGRKRRDISTEGSRHQRSIDDDKPHQEVLQANESLEIYVGFQLDGVSSYRNLTDNKDLQCCHVITFHETVPQVSEVQTFGEHVPGRFIHIKGSGFLAGFQQSDYNVSVGEGWAEDISDITDNEIICLPPDELPGKKNKTQAVDSDGESSTHQEKDLVVDVFVHAGRYHKMLAGTLSYSATEETPDNAAYLVIIAVCSALSVLVVVLVVLAVIVIGLYLRIKRMKRSAAHEQGSPAPRPEAAQQEAPGLPLDALASNSGSVPAEEIPELHLGYLKPR